MALQISQSGRKDLWTYLDTITSVLYLGSAILPQWGERIFIPKKHLTNIGDFEVANSTCRFRRIGHFLENQSFLSTLSQWSRYVGEVLTK